MKVRKETIVKLVQTGLEIACCTIGAVASSVVKKSNKSTASKVLTTVGLAGITVLAVEGVSSIIENINLDPEPDTPKKLRWTDRIRSEMSDGSSDEPERLKPVTPRPRQYPLDTFGGLFNGIINQFDNGPIVENGITRDHPVIMWDTVIDDKSAYLYRLDISPSRKLRKLKVGKYNLSDRRKMIDGEGIDIDSIVEVAYQQDTDFGVDIPLRDDCEIYLKVYDDAGVAGTSMPGSNVTFYQAIRFLGLSPELESVAVDALTKVYSGYCEDDDEVDDYYDDDDDDLEEDIDDD